MKSDGENGQGDMWIKEGDKNTKVLHVVASTQRRVNHIKSITIDDATLLDKEAISSSIVNYFYNLYSDNALERLHYMSSFHHCFSIGCFPA